MEKILTRAEIAQRAAGKFLKDGGEVQQDGEDTQVSYFVGELESGRRARVRVAEDAEGMMTVTVLVPGGGGLGCTVKLWADEATESRVERHLNYAFGKHQQALTASTQ